MIIIREKKKKVYNLIPDVLTNYFRETDTDSFQAF